MLAGRREIEVFAVLHQAGKQQEDVAMHLCDLVSALWRDKVTKLTKHEGECTREHRENILKRERKLWLVLVSDARSIPLRADAR